jgi:hypothetical protein
LPKSSGQLSIVSNAALRVYDVLGREIETLVSKELQPGIYQVNWNAGDFPSGVYFYQLRIRNYELGIEYEETRRMVLVK